MAMVVKRQADGAETWNLNGTCESAEIPFYVIEPTSKKAAIEAVQAAAPTVYGGLPLTKLRFDGYDGGGNIAVVAVYEAADNSNAGGDEDEATVSFDCSGGTKHVVHAISQKKVFGENQSVDDAGGGIGWNGKSGSEAEFAGVDVPTADMRETYSKTMSQRAITSTNYKRRMGAMVGCVNDSKFMGWEPGECMFLGCSYSASRYADKVVVTYHFRINPNEKNCKVAGQNCGDKKGFEYLWGISETVNGDNGKPKVNLKAAYNSVVCNDGNFAVFGL